MMVALAVLRWAIHWKGSPKRHARMALEGATLQRAAL